MTRDDAVAMAERMNARDPHPDPGYQLVAVESPRTLLDEPKYGGWYCRREKTKTPIVADTGGGWPFED